jgi:hypothetical protein
MRSGAPHRSRSGATAEAIGRIVQELPTESAADAPGPAGTTADMERACHRSPERGESVRRSTPRPMRSGTAGAERPDRQANGRFQSCRRIGRRSVSQTETAADVEWGHSTAAVDARKVRLVPKNGTNGSLFPILLNSRGGIFSGDRFTPVETDGDIAILGVSRIMGTT